MFYSMYLYRNMWSGFSEAIFVVRVRRYYNPHKSLFSTSEHNPCWRGYIEIFVFPHPRAFLLILRHIHLKYFYWYLTTKYKISYNKQETKHIKI
jgi:hypothetical protein